jgi:hypothetical protein
LAGFAGLRGVPEVSLLLLLLLLLLLSADQMRICMHAAACLLALQFFNTYTAAAVALS